MQENFPDILHRVLIDEGGYGYDPADPGGPTKYGITIYDVRMYVKKGATAQDVKDLTLDQAKEIYKSKYWDKVNGDGLPSGVDYSVFDYGVNSGVNRANSVFKRLTNPDPVKTINAICDQRLAFLRSLSTFNHFGRGWTRRVAGVRQYSLELTKKVPQWSTTPTPSLPPQPKPSPTISWLPSIFKGLLTLLQRIFSMASSKGNVQTH